MKNSVILQNNYSKQLRKITKIQQPSFLEEHDSPM